VINVKGGDFHSWRATLRPGKQIANGDEKNCQHADPQGATTA
jgi:hypothetical protein